MKLPRRQILKLAAGAAALPALPRAVFAQAYPARPVRLLVGYAPGGVADILGRLIAQWLAQRLNGQFVVENRPGAAGNIATEAVVKSPPDGHTLIVLGSNNAINATLYDNLAFDNVPSSIGYIRAGQLRALAVTTASRLDVLPDVPTVAESVPGFEAIGWTGLGAPRGTPPEVVATLNREVNAALADPGFKARLADLGGVPLAGSPSEFAKFFADDTLKWSKVVRAANLKAE